ncbi:MAG: YciI family protein [Anaerolineae bacterium]|nr:YciI family protein [Anaerolineae bacterium]
MRVIVFVKSDETSEAGALPSEASLATVIDGPFPNPRELVAGYWMWRVGSMDEAVAWVKRIPNDDGTFDGEYEIRPVMEDEDFGDAFTPELREQEERLRAQTEAVAGR